MSITAKNIKQFFLLAATFFATYFYTKQVAIFVENGEYFQISKTFGLQTVGLMILSTYLLAISISTWEKWWQSQLTTLAISAALAISLFNINYTYAYIMGAGALLIMALETYRSYNLKNKFIKYDPAAILRFSTKGMLFLFSILAGIMVILDNSYIDEINIGEKIASYAEKPVKKVVNQQIEEQMVGLESTGLTNFSPEVTTILGNLGIDSIPTDLIMKPQDIDVNVKEIMENQINNFIEPYKGYIQPLLAVAMFGLFQLYTTIAYWIYAYTSGIIFGILKEVGFVKTKVEMVEKEILTL